MVTRPDPSEFTQEKLKNLIEKKFRDGPLNTKSGGRIEVSPHYGSVVGKVMQEYRDEGWRVEGRRPQGDSGHTIIFSRKR